MIGIDKLGCYVPKTILPLTTLAQARGVDPDKYTRGIGQKEMAMISANEDVVTMACEAAHSILDDHDKAQIDMVLFATETGIDYSKAAAIYALDLLGLPASTRAIELKQACYASTGAMFLAMDYVRAHPTKKVLVLSSDIAWYGFESAGEVTQGAGAIAMLISMNPRLGLIKEGAKTVRNERDFYRPLYSKVPVVDGKLSIECYQDMLKEVEDHHPRLYTCFHLPFANMAKKANQVMTHPMDEEHLSVVKELGSIVGNIYNGSLYLSLLSVLMHAKEDLRGETIGMFAYGSGAMAEFFTITLNEHYKAGLNIDSLNQLDQDRIELTIQEYKHVMTQYESKEYSSTLDLSTHVKPYQTYVLDSVSSGHRQYKKLK
jgi:hydroxymethylglutaryl-CoA synthase